MTSEYVNSHHDGDTGAHAGGGDHGEALFASAVRDLSKNNRPSRLPLLFRSLHSPTELKTVP